MAFLPELSKEGRGGTILKADDGEEGGGGGDPVDPVMEETIGGKDVDPGSELGDEGGPFCPIFILVSISVVIVCSSWTILKDWISNVHISPSLRHQLPVKEASVEHGSGGEMLATFADSAVSAAIPMEKKAPNKRTIVWIRNSSSYNSLSSMNYALSNLLSFLD